MAQSLAVPPSPRRGELTRERVLVAATALFAARGFAPITMRAIGDAAALDNSSLYRHFKSKSDLARQVLRRAMAGLAEQVMPTAAGTPATLDGLVHLSTTAALHLWDHPDTARLILHWVTSPTDAATGFDVSLPADAVGEPSGEVFRRIVDLIDQARRVGEIRDVAWPEAFVAAVGAIALRPATYGSFLSSQEPERTADEARRAWQREVGVLIHGMLAV